MTNVSTVPTSSLTSSFIHPSILQSSAIILTTTPAPSTTSFTDFIDRNSQCTDIVGLILACIVFLVAQAVLIAVWYYLYVKIKYQRRALMAATKALSHHKPIEHFPHMNPQPQAYATFSPIHQFPHHLLLSPTHQLQQHHLHQQLLAQQQYLTPVELQAQFDREPVYAPPTTVYTGTVIRHRVGSRISTRHHGFTTKSRVSNSNKRRPSGPSSLLKRTIGGQLRKSGGFHFYPNVMPPHTKLLGSSADSQEESGKSRVYEMFTSSGSQEDEATGTSEGLVSLDPGTRNSLKRNFLYGS